MDGKNFDFVLRDSETPEIVLKKAMKQIEEATRGHVTGNVAAYSGDVFSHGTIIHHHGLEALRGSWEEEKWVNVQKDLGEQDENEYKYEVYLSVKGLSSYKYRLMFVYYNSISYPATLVLNEDVAIAYDGKRNTQFKIESMSELQKMLDIIINSDFMMKLLQNLINESLRQEAKISAAPHCVS